MKKIFYSFCAVFTLFFFLSSAEAGQKTITLQIVNHTGYNISTPYTIATTDHTYASDSVDIANNAYHTISVSNVGTGSTPSVLLSPRLVLDNGEVILGNYCKEYFTKNDMRVTIRYIGDPHANGTFGCDFES